MKKFAKKIIFVSVLIIFLFPVFTFADTQDQLKNFFVNSSYDLRQREQIQAILKKVSQYAYFYLEDDWYKSLT